MTKNRILFALIAILSTMTACSQFAWPKVVERCVPAPELVLSEVLAVLNQSPAPDAALEALAQRYGAEVVLCTVQEVVRQLTQARSSAPIVAAERGREFLARTGAKLPEVK